MSEAHFAEIAVTAVGRDVRRRLGPNAWVVLEELVARAHHVQDGAPVAEVPARDLSQALGLSAEVIRSALRRLAAQRLVEREELRSPRTNRFAGARYRVVGTTGMIASPRGIRAGVRTPPHEPAAHQPSTYEPVSDFPHRARTKAERVTRKRSRPIATGEPVVQPTAQLDLGLNTINLDHDNPSEPHPQQLQRPTPTNS